MPRKPINIYHIVLYKEITLKKKNDTKSDPSMTHKIAHFFFKIFWRVTAYLLSKMCAAHVSGVARVANLNFTPPPLKKFLKNDNKMSSIQHIMCIIISA